MMTRHMAGIIVDSWHGLGVRWIFNTHSCFTIFALFQGSDFDIQWIETGYQAVLQYYTDDVKDSRPIPGFTLPASTWVLHHFIHSLLQYDNLVLASLPEFYFLFHSEA